jgi:hypothetical protein
VTASKLGDIVAGLRQATMRSRAAGNVVAEAICMSLAAIPLAARGERSDADELLATIERIRTIRFTLALTTVAANVALWFARVDGPSVAEVVDGWLRAHVANAHHALQPSLRQLDELLNDHRSGLAAARGASMTHAELIDYLHDELTDMSTNGGSQRPAGRRPQGFPDRRPA